MRESGRVLLVAVALESRGWWSRFEVLQGRLMVAGGGTVEMASSSIMRKASKFRTLSLDASANLAELLTSARLAVCLSILVGLKCPATAALTPPLWLMFLKHSCPHGSE